MKGRPVLGVSGMTVRECPTQEEAVRYLRCHDGDRRWVRILAFWRAGPFRAFYGLRLPIRGFGIFPKEIDVNVSEKYRYNPVFLETGRFNQDLTCKNSGAVRVTFFPA